MRNPFAMLGITDEEYEAPLRAQSVAEGKRLLEAMQARAKQRYRALALELHPDRTGNDEAKTERFKSITAAYDKLMELEVYARQPPQQMQVIRVTFTGGCGVGFSTSSATTSSAWESPFASWTTVG